MSELPKRITGTELEWGLVVTKTIGGRTQEAVPTDQVLSEVIKQGVAASGVQSVTDGSDNHFLANGARLYRDFGSHLEYSTPEDDSLWGTVANEIAAETFVKGMLDHAVAQDIIKSYRLNKRVMDSNGVTWGYHESYYLPGTVTPISQERMAVIAAHMATRQIFTGAGYQRPNGAFTISQKICGLNQEFHKGTTNDHKPLVNERDEPLTGDKVIGKRLHLTSGDPNMSPWATFMKLATTSLVARLVEHKLTDIAPIRPTDGFLFAAHYFNADTTLQKAIPATDGNRITAIDIQEFLLSQVRKLSERVELPAEEQTAVAMWQDALDSLRRDPDELTTKVDWMAKRTIIDRKAEQHSYRRDDPRRRNFDMGWGDMSDKGIGLALRDSKGWRTWLDNDLVKVRVGSAPQTTRAAIRSQVIDYLAGMQDELKGALKRAMNWDNIRVGDQSLVLPDPAAVDTKSMEAFMTDINANYPRAVLRKLGKKRR